jgi:hypothetical protein
LRRANAADAIGVVAVQVREGDADIEVCGRWRVVTVAGLSGSLSMRRTVA